MTALFPFTAIVGQDNLKTALIVNAVDPGVGGVLIRGEKGTAKSTIARSLADLLPEIEAVADCPYSCDPKAPADQCPYCSTSADRSSVRRRMRVVALPANATEDRVAGTLDVEHALRHGKRRFEPGVLAEAHRGILYIDEVNLLDDHIVDLLLDAAAMGINTVEREGISFSHPARFMLIGTMNPEEGDLRPQLLDRFGLCVDAEALMDVPSRTDIVRRRLEWERDPESFLKRYEVQQQKLSAEIAAAKELLPDVRTPDGQLTAAAAICIELDVRSHRADIVMVRAARALAALDGRQEVSEQDLRRAALPALAHRMRRRPFEESRLDPECIEQALHASDRDEKQDRPESDETQPETKETGEQLFEIGGAPDLQLNSSGNRCEPSGAGRRSKTATGGGRGRYSRSARPSGPYRAGDIAVDATLRAAVSHQPAKQDEKPLEVQPAHVRVKRRTGPAGTTVVIVVDASGSMAASRRMAAAKGAALSLLQDAYVKRNRVALLAFRDQQAEVLLQPTDNVDLAHDHLKDMPTGGRTPLAHGLGGALELAHQARLRDADTRIMTVLISDGKANVPYADRPGEGVTPFDEAVDVARQLVLSDSGLLVLDTEDDFLSLGLARRLADASGSDYVRLSHIEAGEIEGAVRKRL